MSGGSFNYLCFAVDNMGLSGREGDIRRMAETLDSWSPAAAQATRAVLDAMERTDELARSLTDVWKAVEWKLSADWGMDQVEEVLKAWEYDNAREKEEKNPYSPGTDLYEDWNYVHGIPGHYLLENGKAVATRRYEIREVVR